jgi:hypothetical protein
MLPHALQTDSLPVLTAWARQHCKNAIQDAILFHAPDHFSWEDCDQVEERMLAEFEPVIAPLTVDRLRNLKYMNSLIDDAVAETVRVLRQGPWRG